VKLAVLTYFDANELDIALPYGVLAAATRATRIPCEAFTIGKAAGASLVLAAGLRAAPNYSLGNAPEADVLVLPGGPGAARLATDPIVRHFVEQRAQASRFVLAIGTGAALLGAAGLLEGLPVPAGANDRGVLSPYRPGDEVEEHYLRANRTIYFSRGGTATIGALLEILENLHGNEAATAAAAELGYPHGSRP
jgi:putative intracellular protease/amidase